MRKSGFLGVVLMVLFALPSGNVAWAQVLASITGRVADASNASVPDVTIAVTDLETGSTRTVVTDSDGNYRVLSLPVGRYEIKAEKTGFKTAVQTGVDLVVGEQAAVNLVLQVGDVQQAVTVTSDAPVVNTSTAAVSGLVGEAQVKDLPLNGRSYDNLITLNPGTLNNTSHTTTSASGLGAGNSFAVDGRRPTENLFLLNGIELMGNSTSGVTPGGASGELLGIDGIREFNLLTDTYSAEYGKVPGGQVLVVTQSGTNQVHGTVFEFLRNSDLDARNFFDAPPAQIGHRIPEFQRNQFGGALGGPIRKDKIFAFGNYEGFRQRLGLSDVSVVPDNNARTGILPCTAAAGATACKTGMTVGTPIAVQGALLQMEQFFQLWPQANGVELGGGLALNSSSPKQSVREDYGTIRLDETLSSRDSLSEIYTVDDGYNDTPQTNPLFIADSGLRNQVASLQETHIFSPTKINAFRVGFSRGAFNFNVAPNGVTFPTNLSLFAGLEPGAITISGGTGANAAFTGNPTAGTQFAYLQGARNQFTYTDDFQWIKGKHQISFGASLERLQDNRADVGSKAGVANFASLTTFLQGTTSSFQGSPNSNATYYRMWMGAWYVEDNIQVRRNLTVRIGVRHEFDNGWPEKNGNESVYTYTDGIMNTVAQPGVAFIQNNAKWLFGPRVGLAWDVFGNGKTAVRAGFGTHYDLLDTLGQKFDVNPPNSLLVFGTNVPFLPLIPVEPGVPSPPQCNVGVTGACSTYSAGGLPPNAKTPTVEEWNLGVEQQITSTTALRVAYVGSHGYHEFDNVDYNAIHPLICSTAAGCLAGGVNAKVASIGSETVSEGMLYVPACNVGMYCNTALGTAPGGPNTRPNPYLGRSNMSATNAISSYNALQVELTQRLSKGLQFRANYTWGKNMDTQSSVAGSGAVNGPTGPMDPYNPRGEYGPSTMDATDTANVSAIYNLPIGRGQAWLGGVTGVADKLVSGWQMNVIVSVLSGLPFTVQDGTNQSGNGVTSGDRPNLNPGFSLASITSGTTGPANSALGTTAAVPQGFACTNVPANMPLGTPTLWFNPCAFSFAQSGTFGNMSRDELRGPGLTDLDMSFFKNTALTERVKLQFRAEMFNILNHTNLSTPNLTVFSGTAINPAAGIITSTATTSRQVQFGLKLIF